MATRVLGPRGSRRRRRFLLVPIAFAAIAVVLTVGRAGAANQGGFEIDAASDNATHSNALYSGTLPTPGDDWAPGSSNQGVFSNTGTTPALPGGSNCYGSNIFLGGAVDSASSAFICDGNSDPRLSAFPEENIVSPSGKTPDPSWPIRPGNVRAKNDFSQAYVYTRKAHSPCSSNPSSQDPILYVGGHVGDNEGDHFWGFEFDKNTPTNFDQLQSNSGNTFTLGFNRSIGDILVSITVPGSGPPLLELFKVTGFNSDGTAIFTLAGAQAGCPPSAPQGLSEIQTNTTNDILAPPWNVPVCDPTSEDPSNSCRLANGTNTAPNDKLLAPRDFAEASVDLTAFGINPCFTNVIFTSRSAHVLTGADVQDVGGATFPLCGKKTGTKFEDLNGNGVKDPGEPPLQGWPINLYRDAGTIGVLDAADDSDPSTPGIQPFKTMQTDASGTYSFDTLGNGTYIVCEAQNPPPGSGLPPTGWHESLPNTSTPPPGAGETNADCSADSSLSGVGYAFTMTGQTLDKNDFGNFQQGTKSGTKFKDVNANGVRDLPDDVGLSGWTIRAYVDTNGDGTLQAGETTIAASQVTDASGNYTLSLNPGKYVVCEVAQATWFQSAPSNSKCSAVNPGAGVAAGGFAVTITSRSTETGNLFGNYQQGTKSGTKFNDLNANGVRDPGDPGLFGWTIRAYVDTNGDGVLQSGETTIAASQVTDSSGNYTLTLNPGKYVVCEVAQATWFQSAPSNSKCSAINPGAGVGNGGFAVTITSGSTETGNDFGNYQQGTKSGTKFNDMNANGVRDPGDAGLPGWTIRAYVDTNGDGTLEAGETTIAASQVTDGNGNYAFTLNPGNYVVCEVAQATWFQSAPSNSKCSAINPAAGVGDGGFAVTITSGSTETGNDFGNFQAGTKSGTKFNDLNANGVRDLPGDAGLPGWVILAYVDTNHDGILQAGETTIAASDTTDANGNYLLTLNPGTYVVCEVLEAGWFQSAPSNSRCAAINPGAGVGDGGFAVTITSGSTEVGNDFGNFQQGTKSGTKFNDLNANGVRDPGDPGLSGWTIRAYVDTNGDGTLQAGETTVAASTVTDTTGNYTFTLDPGTYVVCEVLQADWFQSAPSNSRCSAINPAAGVADGGFAVTITSGSTETGNDFGNFQQGTKSGTKFNDLNANGVRDSGDPGLSGWTIRAYVDTNGDGTLQPGETTIAASQLTDSSGNYTLTLDPGNYVVCEVLQATWFQSAPSNTRCSAINPAAGVGDGGFAVTITSGSTETGNDFGNFQQGTKSGTKFNDLNANGVRDLPGDVGLGGWGIEAFVDTNHDGTLQADETTMAASTTTDANGHYTLTLDPGTYVVCEVLQASWFQSTPSNDRCTAINPAAGVADGGFAVTITSGSTEIGNDFGNFQQGTKSGTKFNDLNANGVRDLPGDAGLANWTIRAYVDTNGDGTLETGETTIAASQLTDSSGNYTLTLDPGHYVVCEVLQASWFQSAPSNSDCSAINPDAGVADGGFAVTITSGSTEIGNDFGNFQQGTKSGTKFNDLNANGVRDSGDPGLSGWTIRAYVDANHNGTLEAGETTIAASTTTDVNGDYLLTLNPGTYVVCEVLQDTWFQSAPSNSNCTAINPAAGVADGGFAVTITSGSTEIGNDFGNFQQGTKSGTKFNDLNANGVRDPGDPGLSGWTIRAYVDTNHDGTLQAGETTIATSDTTNGSGDYLLTLNPGYYVVCEVLQASWIQSAPNNSNCSAINPDAGVADGGFAVRITSGSTETGNLFGNYQQATIAGTKFKDVNNNHGRDPGEGGLQGWTIHVYDDSGATPGSLDATDALVDTQVTDANGAYTTTSLSPGTYYVCEVGQTNWRQTYPTAATDGATSCDAQDGGQGWKIVITSGTNATVKDFGNTPLSHITANFFSDAQLFGGGDATHATSITCVDANGNPVGDQDASGNGFHSGPVTLDQSAITCTITFTDP